MTALCKTLSQWRKNMGFLNLHHQSIVSLWTCDSLQISFTLIWCCGAACTTLYCIICSIPRHNVICNTKEITIVTVSVWDIVTVSCHCVKNAHLTMPSSLIQVCTVFQDDTTGTCKDYKLRTRTKEALKMLQLNILPCRWPQQKTKRDREDKQTSGMTWFNDRGKMINSLLLIVGHRGALYNKRVRGKARSLRRGSRPNVLDKMVN